MSLNVPCLSSHACNTSATAACKLVADCFDWRNGSVFTYTQRNHTSVVGIREIALRRGAAVRMMRNSDNVQVDCVLQRCDCADNCHQWLTNDSSNAFSSHLYAMPAQCNFSGSVTNFASVCAAIAQRNRLCELRTYTLLDAACYVSTHDLDLSEIPADFVCLSFYKMFGWPTSVGALIVRRDAVDVLLRQKQYFGGGTIATLRADRLGHTLRATVRLSSLAFFLCHLSCMLLERTYEIGFDRTIVVSAARRSTALARS